MIARRTRRRFRDLPTFVVFAIGGSSIALLGIGILWMLVYAGVNVFAASAVELGITLALGFAFNWHVTWRSQQQGRMMGRIAAFLAVRSSIQATGWGIFAALVNHDVHYQIANLAALLVGATCNYQASRMVFDDASREAVTQWYRRVAARVTP